MFRFRSLAGISISTLCALCIIQDAQAAYIGCRVTWFTQQPEQWGNGVYNESNVCEHGYCRTYWFNECELNCNVTICYAADSVTSHVPVCTPVQSGPIDISCGSSQAFPIYSSASGSRGAYACLGISSCGNCNSDPWQGYIDDWNGGSNVITDYVTLTCLCPTGP